MLKLFGYNYINKLNVKNNIDALLPDNIFELNQRISNCNLCELSKKCTSKSLYDSKSYSDIIILVPEVLSNNKLNILKNVLKDYLDINIDNVVIINIIKCITNNTEINEYVFDICKDYTVKEIDIISAKVILCFGNIYKYIVKNDLNIGEFTIYNKSKLFYLNDLNLLLRNPSIMVENKNIFYKIKHEMEKI
jgi:uracil-DNA glycosylase